MVAFCGALALGAGWWWWCTTSSKQKSCLRLITQPERKSALANKISHLRRHYKVFILFACVSHGSVALVLCACLCVCLRVSVYASVLYTLTS